MVISTSPRHHTLRKYLSLILNAKYLDFYVTWFVNMTNKKIQTPSYWNFGWLSKTASKFTLVWFKFRILIFSVYGHWSGFNTNVIIKIRPDFTIKSIKKSKYVWFRSDWLWIGRYIYKQSQLLAAFRQSSAGKFREVAIDIQVTWITNDNSWKKAKYLVMLSNNDLSVVSGPQILT